MTINSFEKTSEAETLETLFYVAMKAYPQFLIVAEEYAISGRTFNCDVYASSESFESALSELHDKVRARHREAYHIKAMVEKPLKETMSAPLQYIKGHVVRNGILVHAFGILSPREKTEFEWVKTGLFKQKQIEKKSAKEDNEFETANSYYQYTASPNPLEGEELAKAKLHIVKSLHRKISLSEETLVYQNFERVWEGFLHAGEVGVPEFEKFLTDMYKFKELSSPEVKPLANDLYNSIYLRKSIMNQYELIRTYEPARKIYFS